MTTRIRATAAAVAMTSIVAGVSTAAPSFAGGGDNVGQQEVTTTATYVLPTISPVDVATGVGLGAFPVSSWARSFSVAVTDASGLPTAGDIKVVTYNPGSQVEEVAGFCGRTASSYAIDPTQVAKLLVALRQGPCSDGTLAAGTVGLISITFTS
jgi:hypothetical protein